MLVLVGVTPQTADQVTGRRTADGGDDAAAAKDSYRPGFGELIGERVIVQAHDAPPLVAIWMRQPETRRGPPPRLGGASPQSAPAGPPEPRWKNWPSASHPPPATGHGGSPRQPPQRGRRGKRKDVLAHVDPGHRGGAEVVVAHADAVGAHLHDAHPLSGAVGQVQEPRLSEETQAAVLQCLCGGEPVHGLGDMPAEDVHRAKVLAFHRQPADQLPVSAPVLDPVRVHDRQANEGSGAPPVISPPSNRLRVPGSRAYPGTTGGPTGRQIHPSTATRRRAWGGGGSYLPATTCAAISALSTASSPSSCSRHTLRYPFQRRNGAIAVSPATIRSRCPRPFCALSPRSGAPMTPNATAAYTSHARPVPSLVRSSPAALRFAASTAHRNAG